MVSLEVRVIQRRRDEELQLDGLLGRVVDLDLLRDGSPNLNITKIYRGGADDDLGLLQACLHGDDYSLVHVCLYFYRGIDKGFALPLQLVPVLLSRGRYHPGTSWTFLEQS